MLHLLIFLAVVGVLLWAVNTYIPMDAKIKQIINVVAIICVVVWLLEIFGVLGLVDVPVPRLGGR
jgi:hypothetical protein